MSFAIIETGGKQYKISDGDVLRVEKLPGDLKEGDKVIFEKVLLSEDNGDIEIGMPYLTGKTIEARFVLHAKGKKIHIIRFRQKSRYHKKTGHRQPYSELSIGKEKKSSSKAKEITSQKNTATKATPTEVSVKKGGGSKDVGKKPQASAKVKETKAYSRKASAKKK